MGPDTLEDVPKFLLSAIPVLKGSQEYNRLDEDSRRIPGLVMGQVAILLRRLHAEQLETHTAGPGVSDQLHEVSAAIETLARSPLPKVRNLVVVEILEHLHGTPELRRAILHTLGPSTRALYAEWIEPTVRMNGPGDERRFT